MPISKIEEHREVDMPSFYSCHLILLLWDETLWQWRLYKIALVVE
jgi:hypothetical protein